MKWAYVMIEGKYLFNKKRRDRSGTFNIDIRKDLTLSSFVLDSSIGDLC